MLTVVRLISVLSIAWLTDKANMWLFNAVLITGMAHYTLSYYYARRNIVAAASRAPSAIGLVGLLALAIWLWKCGAPLIVIFLPHGVFNEVYISKKELPKNSTTKPFILSALILNALIYSALLDLDEFLPFHVSSELILGATITAAIWFAINLWKIKSNLNMKNLLDACSLELAGLALVTFSATGVLGLLQINFYQIVLYHFVFWTLYPMTELYKARKFDQARNYLVINSAVLACSYLIGSTSILPYHFSTDIWISLFYLFSFLHILSSLGLSRAQPDWIWRFFLPDPNKLLQPTPVRSENVATAV